MFAGNIYFAHREGCNLLVDPRESAVAKRSRSRHVSQTRTPITKLYSVENVGFVARGRFAGLVTVETSKGDAVGPDFPGRA